MVGALGLLRFYEVGVVWCGVVWFVVCCVWCVVCVVCGVWCVWYDAVYHRVRDVLLCRIARRKARNAIKERSKEAAKPLWVEPHKQCSSLPAPSSPAATACPASSRPQEARPPPPPRAPMPWREAERLPPAELKMLLQLRRRDDCIICRGRIVAGVLRCGNCRLPFCRMHLEVHRQNGGCWTPLLPTAEAQQQWPAEEELE